MYCYDISNFAQKLLSKMHLSKYYKDTKRNLKPGAKSFEKWYLYNFVEWGSSIMFSKLCILKVVHVSATRASFQKEVWRTNFLKVWSPVSTALTGPPTPYSKKCLSHYYWLFFHLTPFSQFSVYKHLLLMWNIGPISENFKDRWIFHVTFIKKRALPVSIICRRWSTWRGIAVLTRTMA